MTRTPRRRRVPLTLLAALAVAVGLSGCQESRATSSAAATTVAEPRVIVQAGTSGLADWSRPLQLTVTDGRLRSVVVTDPLGFDVPGALGHDHWASHDTLVPDSAYHVAATVENAAGTARRFDLTTRTSPATRVLRATLSPESDEVVGVGLPVIVTLNRDVTDPDDRKAVESRLRVDAAPAVTGAWRWMSPRELHYRGPRYWAKGTQLSVHSDFTALKLAHGVWGSGAVDTSFTIGSSVVATVDVDKKVMTVVVDGTLVRTVKVSTGRDKYPTKGGVHLVLEKVRVEVMDSQTVGIPRTSPDGYYEKVPNSVRISYGGAFVHSASWSVQDQGVRNVSHGCVNVSPADAAWFFDLVKRGDIVDVVNAKAPPLLSDPGMSDWNIPFATWAD